MATIIRPEHPDDHAGIEEVNRLAFGQDDEARLVAKLRLADGFDPALSLVAVRDGTVEGSYKGRNTANVGLVGMARR